MQRNETDYNQKTVQAASLAGVLQAKKLTVDEIYQLALDASACSLSKRLAIKTS